MVIKRKDALEDVIKMANGGKLYMLSSTDSLENMKELADDALKAFEANPNLSNRLGMLYNDADYRFAKGEREKVAEDLKAAVDSIAEMTNNPDCLLKWMDLLSLLTEILLTVNRPKEALEYANRVIDLGEGHFFETLEYAYAEELYATVQAVLGNFDEAKAFYQDSLGRFKEEINQARQMIDNIQHNLDSIDGKE